VPSFEKNPEHRSNGKLTALKSALWQWRHRGPWAPAFAGETKESTEEPEKREGVLI